MINNIRPKHRKRLQTAFLLFAISVLTGAFGAHALKEIISETQLMIWNKANFYLFIHAGGLALLTLSSDLSPKAFSVPAKLMFIGTILFSGSLFILSTSALFGIQEHKWIGIITPFGGISLALSWILAAIELARNKANS